MKQNFWNNRRRELFRNELNRVGIELGINQREMAYIIQDSAPNDTKTPGPTSINRFLTDKARVRGQTLDKILVYFLPYLDRVYGGDFISGEFPALWEMFVERNELIKEKEYLLERPLRPGDSLRFDISKSTNRLELVTPPMDSRDRDTFLSLRDELLSGSGPLDYLSNYYRKSNLPQAEVLKSAIGIYQDELSKDPSDINFAILYARGERVSAAYKAANRQISIGAWPEYSPEEHIALQEIVELHGPLVLTSDVGRRLLLDAQAYQLSDWEQSREVIQEFNQVISQETQLFDDKTVAVLSEITSADPKVRVTNRILAVQIAVISSLLALVLGGASTYLGRGLSAVAGSGLTRGMLGSYLSTVWASSGSTLPRQAARTALQNAQVFQKISRLRPDLRWVSGFYDDIDRGVFALLEEDLTLDPPVFTPSIYLESGDHSAINDIEVATVKLLKSLGYSQMDQADA